MKKFFSLMIAAAFVFGTVGCDEKKPTSPAKTEKKDEKKEEKKEEKKS